MGFKHFVFTFIHAFCFVLFTKIFQWDIFVGVMKNLYDPGISNFKDVIACMMMVIICLFGIIGTIFFFCLTVYDMAMIFICTFITDNRKIHVAVDENHIIHDTFLELSNGKIIPIKITKLKMEKSKEEVGEQ